MGDGLKRAFAAAKATRVKAQPMDCVQGRFEEIAREYDKQAELHATRKDFSEASVWVNRAIVARAVAQLFASDN